MITIHGHVGNTRNYGTYIIKDDTIDDSWPQCKANSETIQQITSECLLLEDSEYKLKHDRAAKILNLNLVLNYELLNGKLFFINTS